VNSWNADDVNVTLLKTWETQEWKLNVSWDLKLRWSIFRRFVVPSLGSGSQSSEDERTAILRNFGKHSSNSTAAHLRGLETSTTPLWELQISLETISVCYTIKFWWPTLNSLQTFNEVTVSSLAHITCIFKFSSRISKHDRYKCVVAARILQARSGKVIGCGGT
jgi:hypothetical protein